MHTLIRSWNVIQVYRSMQKYNRDGARSRPHVHDGSPFPTSLRPSLRHPAPSSTLSATHHAPYRKTPLLLDSNLRSKPMVPSILAHTATASSAPRHQSYCFPVCAPDGDCCCCCCSGVGGGVVALKGRLMRTWQHSSPKPRLCSNPTRTPYCEKACMSRVRWWEAKNQAGSIGPDKRRTP